MIFLQPGPVGSAGGVFSHSALRYYMEPSRSAPCVAQSGQVKPFARGRLACSTLRSSGSRSAFLTSAACEEWKGGLIASSARDAIGIFGNRELPISVSSLCGLDLQADMSVSRSAIAQSGDDSGRVGKRVPTESNEAVEPGPRIRACVTVLAPRTNGPNTRAPATSTLRYAKFGRDHRFFALLRSNVLQYFRDINSSPNG